MDQLSMLMNPGATARFAASMVVRAVASSKLSHRRDLVSANPNVDMLRWLTRAVENEASADQDVVVGCVSLVLGTQESMAEPQRASARMSPGEMILSTESLEMVETGEPAGRLPTGTSGANPILRSMASPGSVEHQWDSGTPWRGSPVPSEQPVAFTAAKFRMPPGSAPAAPGRE